MDAKTTSRDAQARLTTRDDGRFTRTAIQLDGWTITSLDVLDADGKLFCRLNLVQFASTPGAGSVDVILDPQTQRGTFLAWDRGILQVRKETVEGTTVHAVAIRRA